TTWNACPRGGGRSSRRGSTPTRSRCSPCCRCCSRSRGTPSATGSSRSSGTPPRRSSESPRRFAASSLRCAGRARATTGLRVISSETRSSRARPRFPPDPRHGPAAGVVQFPTTEGEEVETQLETPVQAGTASRSGRARAIALLGPLTVLAGLVWAIVQPYRLTLLHPHHQGFWWLVVEPPLLVVAAGLFFSIAVARPLL